MWHSAMISFTGDPNPKFISSLDLCITHGFKCGCGKNALSLIMQNYSKSELVEGQEAGADFISCSYK